MAEYAMGGGRTLRFSRAAQTCIDETGTDPIDDVVAIVEQIRISGSGGARANLLAYCLDGAADDRRDGWIEYVNEIMAHATA